MWLIVSFDLPSIGREAAKHYRKLKKTLASCGFSAVQKSVAWRWCEDHERRDGVIAKVRRQLSEDGDLLFFSIPDDSFQSTIHVSDGNVRPPPEPPEPWLIFA